MKKLKQNRAEQVSQAPNFKANTKPLIENAKLTDDESISSPVVSEAAYTEDSSESLQQRHSLYGRVNNALK